MSPDSNFAERLLRIKKRLIDTLGADRPELNEAVEKWFDATIAGSGQIAQLNDEAKACLATGDWAKAEAKYKEILELPELENVRRYAAHTDLAGLYGLLSRSDDAVDAAHQATVAARAEQMNVLVGMALRGEAECLIQADRAAEALPLVEESLAHLGDDAAFDLLQARHFVLRAGCRLRLAKFDDVQSDLDEVFRLYQPRDDDAIAIGVQSDLSAAWSIQAELRAARHDKEGAIDAWRRAVAKAKLVDDSPLPNSSTVFTKLAIAQMLAGLAAALTQAGLEEDAAAARTEREEILRAIGLAENH